MKEYTDRQVQVLCKIAFLTGAATAKEVGMLKVAGAPINKLLSPLLSRLGPAREEASNLAQIATKQLTKATKKGKGTSFLNEQVEKRIASTPELRGMASDPKVRSQVEESVKKELAAAKGSTAEAYRRYRV
jgi:hypothetical protein